MQEPELHAGTLRAQHGRHGDRSGRSGGRPQRRGGKKPAAAQRHFLFRHGVLSFDLTERDMLRRLLICLRSGPWIWRRRSGACAVFGHDRRPRFRVRRSRAHQIHFERIAVRPIKRVQMLDRAAGLIEHDAHKLDQRRAGADVERLRSGVARPALIRWRAFSTLMPARSRSSSSGREASSCLVKVTATLSGTWVVR